MQCHAFRLRSHVVQKRVRRVPGGVQPLTLNSTYLSPPYRTLGVTEPYANEGSSAEKMTN